MRALATIVLACALKLLSAGTIVMAAADISGGMASLSPIAAQPLATALTAVERMTGLKIVYVSELVQGKTSPGAPAGLSAVETLTRVLEGTGLTYKRLNERTVAIRAVEEQRADGEGSASGSGVEEETGLLTRNIAGAARWNLLSLGNETEGELTGISEIVAVDLDLNDCIRLMQTGTLNTTIECVKAKGFGAVVVEDTNAVSLMTIQSGNAQSTASGIYGGCARSGVFSADHYRGSLRSECNAIGDCTFGNTVSIRVDTETRRWVVGSYDVRVTIYEWTTERYAVDPARRKPPPIWRVTDSEQIHFISSPASCRGFNFQEGRFSAPQDIHKASLTIQWPSTSLCKHKSYVEGRGMQLSTLTVKRFRSVWEDTVYIDGLTAIVGPNGAGKSTLLRALREFYSTQSSVSLDDFYNRDSNQPIEISLSFNGLSDKELELFRPYVDQNTLTVTKVITSAGAKYHGVRLQHPPFVEIRRLNGKAERVAELNRLRQQQIYVDMVVAGRSADAAEQAMSDWEVRHPKQCQMLADDGQFFGFRQVGQSKLERFTRFLLIPAVTDAEADAADRRGSPVFELMELVVRSAIVRDSRIQELKQRIQTEYAALVGPESVPQLAGLNTQLTDVLQTYVPSASVQIDWSPADEISLPFPKAQVRLLEDGFSAPVDRVGHGLQRAFVLSLLQVLVSSASATEENAGEVDSSDMPDLILAIEEPELYQHPNRQRHFSRVLKSLSAGTLPGVARRTQVVYCTHSPLFVDISMFNSVRRLCKVNNPVQQNVPLMSKCTAAMAHAVATRLQDAQPQPSRVAFTGDGFISRCGHLLGPMINEGFFADVAVLVEGEEDRAAILGCAEELGVQLEALGIAVLPVGGKSNLDRPFLVFTSLGIPTYMVFDVDPNDDKPSNTRANRALQRLLGIDSNRVVDFPQMQVESQYAAFSPNLTAYLRTQAGEAYDNAITHFREEYGYADGDACRKSTKFVSALVRPLATNAASIRELRALIRQISMLSPHYVVQHA